MKLIKDLGLIYRTPRSRDQERYGIYECPKCKRHRKVLMRAAKKYPERLCPSCSKIKENSAGESGTRLYQIWNGMVQRCHNSKSAGYYDYGYRGITVCDEWRTSFFAFKTWALTNGYSIKLTIDRINNNGNYGSTNCRWATQTQQVNNQRMRSTNKSGYRGVSWADHASSWCARLCVDYKRYHLGYFKCKIEAAETYDAEIQRRGLIDKPLNFPAE